MEHLFNRTVWWRRFEGTSNASQLEKLGRALRKEGSLSIGDLISTNLVQALPRACNTNLLRSLLCFGLFISAGVYPKGITFPLGSCLSRTNSRNWSRPWCPRVATMIFPRGGSSYQENPTERTPFFSLLFDFYF